MSEEEFQFLCNNQRIWKELWLQSERNKRQIKLRKALEYKLHLQRKLKLFKKMVDSLSEV
jgi:hypothetical protein